MTMQFDKPCDNLSLISARSLRFPPAQSESGSERVDARMIDSAGSFVLVGSNGSGKTRMSLWVEQNNAHLPVRRITAQKSLAMPFRVEVRDRAEAESEFARMDPVSEERMSHNRNSAGIRYNSGLAPSELCDFPELVALLVSDESEKSIEFRNRHKSGEAGFDNDTLFDGVKRIWERVVDGKRVEMTSGKLSISLCDGTSYSANELSVGERAVFYYAAEAMCVQEGCLFIVDEPENHLHPAISHRLWDEIESARPDCVFVYLTHNLEFAASRNPASLIWVKGMPEDGVWDYQVMDRLYEDALGLPSELLLRVLGSRREVILVEGEATGSWDRKLFQLLFPGASVIAAGGCGRVASSVRAIRALGPLAGHNSVYGIVDRDCRSDEEVCALREDGIYCLSVAEIENVFLLPVVVRFACARLSIGYKTQEIVQDVECRVLGFLAESEDSQVLNFVRHALSSEVVAVTGAKADSLFAYRESVEVGLSAIRVDELAKSFKAEVNSTVRAHDFEGALKLINDKGLYTKSGLANVLGVNQSLYRELVIRWLGDRLTPERASEADRIKLELIEAFGLQELMSA